MQFYRTFENLHITCFVIIHKCIMRVVDVNLHIKYYGEKTHKCVVRVADVP